MAFNNVKKIDDLNLQKCKKLTLTKQMFCDIISHIRSGTFVL